jgi:hypothetical protein
VTAASSAAGKQTAARPKSASSNSTVTPRTPGTATSSRPPSRNQARLSQHPSTSCSSHCACRTPTARPRPCSAPATTVTKSRASAVLSSASASAWSASEPASRSGMTSAEVRRGYWAVRSVVLVEAGVVGAGVSSRGTRITQASLYHRPRRRLEVVVAGRLRPRFNAREREGSSHGLKRYILVWVRNI